MTRFFSELVLSPDADGTFEPFAGRALRTKPGVKRRIAASLRPSRPWQRRAATRRRRRRPPRSAAVPLQRPPALVASRWSTATRTSPYAVRASRSAHRVATERTGAASGHRADVPAPAARARRGARAISPSAHGRRSRAPPCRRAHLPARAAVADVRRDARALAGADAHPAAAAVPDRLERRARRADRVPGGRRRRRRVHRQLRAARSAISMALRQGRCGVTTPAREDGVVARGLGRQARLPHDGRARLGARPRERGLLWHFCRLAGRVVADRARRRRLLRRVERPALRARPAHAPRCAGRAARREDHLERGDRRRDALHRRLRRPRSGALAAQRARRAGSRSVNGRIYGTPAVAGGRVFVPSSTGGSLTAFSTRGRYLWRVGTGSYVYSSPAAWGGRVFFGSYNGGCTGFPRREGACQRGGTGVRS